MTNECRSAELPKGEQPLEAEPDKIKSNPPRGAIAVAVLLSVLLMAATLWLFTPGLVTYDSVLQFQEAETARFNTTHPPLMAAVWRVLLTVAPGSLGMLILNLTLYWASFAALAAYCLRATGRRWSMLALFGGLWPLLLSFAGVIWKDVTLAAAFGLASTLILLAGQEMRSGLRFWLAWACSAMLLLFGAAIRHNGFPAAIVLAIPLARLLSTTTVRWGAFAGMALLAFAAVPLTSLALGARDSRPLENLIGWDLTGMAYFSGQGSHELACYSPRQFDSCSIPRFAGPVKARAEWLSAIEQHPLAYIRHRALVFSMLLRLGCRECHPYIWEDGEGQLAPGLSYRPNPLRPILGDVVIVIGKTPFGRPYFWLAAAIGLTLMLWRKRGETDCAALSLIALSGCAYTFGYFIAAVTDEFRYIYWLIYAVVLVVGACLFGKKASIRDFVRWALVPAFLVTAVDVAIQTFAPTDHIAPSMATNY